ncbi:MAG: hypothetical protein E7200_05345 [Selenomonas ruminantium]|nr:hypothetical protein [Selenomonas ruminantium]
MKGATKTINENPFGLSDREAARVRVNALRILYTLKAEQDHIEGKIIVKETSRRKVAAMA